MAFDPDAVDTDAFAAAESNFWHDVRDTGTFIWDTKSFIDVVPKIIYHFITKHIKFYITLNTKAINNFCLFQIWCYVPSEIALGSSKELTGTVGTVFTKFTIYTKN